MISDKLSKKNVRPSLIRGVVPDLQKSTNMDPAAKAKDDEEFKMLWLEGQT
jgi:hypothetical protein